MPTWDEMSKESLAAGTLLAAESCYPRSCLSRLYYAAYQACCAYLEYKGRPPTDTVQGTGEVWYAHRRMAEKLQEVAEGQHGLRQLDEESVHAVVGALEQLLKARVEADYHPEAVLDERDVKNALRYTIEVRKRLSNQQVTNHDDARQG